MFQVTHGLLPSRVLAGHLGLARLAHRSSSWSRTMPLSTLDSAAFRAATAAMQHQGENYCVVKVRTVTIFCSSTQATS
jgi:hypothetical protein